MLDERAYIANQMHHIECMLLVKEGIFEECPHCGSNDPDECDKKIASLDEEEFLKGIKKDYL